MASEDEARAPEAHACRVRRLYDLEGHDRLSDILERLAAERAKRETGFLMHLLMDEIRQHDAAGFCERLQPGGGVDDVAEEVLAVVDDVTGMQADAQRQPVAPVVQGCKLSEMLLAVARRAQGLHRAREPGHQAVADSAELPPAVGRDTLPERGTTGLQRGHRRFTVSLHEATVLRYICCQDG